MSSSIQLGSLGGTNYTRLGPEGDDLDPEAALLRKEEEDNEQREKAEVEKREKEKELKQELNDCRKEAVTSANYLMVMGVGLTLAQFQVTSPLKCEFRYLLFIVAFIAAFNHLSFICIMAVRHYGLCKSLNHPRRVKAGYHAILLLGLLIFTVAMLLGLWVLPCKGVPTCSPAPAPF